ncbi:MAG: hypothetical protein ACRDGM_10575 [bacterium]
MKMLVKLGSAAPVLVAVFLVLVIVGVAGAVPRCEKETPQAPVVVSSTTAVERHVEVEGYRGWVVRMEGTQRILGPFRLEADCYGAARMLNGARPNSYTCMAERQ